MELLVVYQWCGVKNVPSELKLSRLTNLCLAIHIGMGLCVLEDGA